MRNLLSHVRDKYIKHRAKNTLEKITREYKIPGTNTYHTPDAPAVGAKDYHLVLFYDDMMLDRPEHFRIEHLIKGRAGQGTTTENVEAWVQNGTTKVLAFPAFHKVTKPAWMDQNGANPSPIKGDLFKFGWRDIFLLDKMFENTVLCNRVEVDTVSWLHKSYFSQIHGRTHTTQENPRYRKAWIYLANPVYWDDKITYDSWKPLTIWTPRKREKGEGIYFHNGAITSAA